MCYCNQKIDSFYFQEKEEISATSGELRLRMLEVNGISLSQLQPEDADVEIIISKSVVPMEAVQSMTNNILISKFLPIPNLIILISVLSIIIIFILIVTLGVIKYLEKTKGETYYTQEELLQAQT